jgi:hypothetical protein
MNKYNVKIYREMRLDFVGIEADTPATAAEIAARRQTQEADNIEDCQGDNLSALVDVAGDEDYRHSVLIDFEAERQRKAATALLASRFEIERDADLPDHIYVEVDHRFNVAIERTESGLEFRIYPRTAGELWDDPFTTFEVDESEILELEKEIGL